MTEEMKKYRYISKEDAGFLKEGFKNAVSLIRSLLGKNAFKRFYRGDARNFDGHWEPKKFNASLFDILMWSMARADKNRAMGHLDSILEGFVSLMTYDDEFIRVNRTLNELAEGS